MEGGKKKGESFAKAKADKEKADKEAKEAAEKASSAEPVVLEEDDEFEEFEQEGARPAAARPRSPRSRPRPSPRPRAPRESCTPVSPVLSRANRSRRLALGTDWTAAEEDADDTKQWQDDWDDDDVTGDFSQALRAEIAKTKAAAGK